MGGCTVPRLGAAGSCFPAWGDGRCRLALVGDPGRWSPAGVGRRRPSPRAVWRGPVALGRGVLCISSWMYLPTFSERVPGGAVVLWDRAVGGGVIYRPLVRPLVTFALRSGASDNLVVACLPPPPLAPVSPALLTLQLIDITLALKNVITVMLRLLFSSFFCVELQVKQGVRV